MKLRFVSFSILATVTLLHIGCTSQLAKRPVVDAAENKAETVVQTIPTTAIPEETINETPADAVIYGEEEAVLSTILNFYDEALEALDIGDYSLAETRIDSAAVLSSGIDIASIGDESLALRYMNTLASLFQDYGRIFKDVDTINSEEPLNWLNQLSESNAENFKNGKWSDEELRHIVQKIALRCDVPIDYNDQVKKSIYFFQTVKRKEMEKWMRRSGQFIPLIHNILEEEDLPLDMAYLAMIESGFSSRAYSRARASGLWQFMYATGRMYGLKRTQWYDQRRDPVKSTRAAARHLKDLFKIYGDWRLVMAAYNWGPSRVTRQVKAGNDDFWTMKMPRETRNYVPSFMAAVIISKAPELFGFENIEKAPALKYDVVEIPYTSLATAAKCAGVELATVKALNTELLKSFTPSGMNYGLRIPSGTKERFLKEYASLPKEKYEPPKVDSYYVRRGDTLSGIAAKFRVSVNSIVNQNNIRNRNRLRVGQRISIPGRGGTVKSSTATVASRPVTSTELATAKNNSSSYTVRRNDSLWTIAVKHKTSVRLIQALNNMGRSSKIVPGQKLKIPSGNAASASTSSTRLASATTNGNGQITYIIKRNDTLYEIARKYNVSHKDIMTWNKIKNHRTIKPGQKIIIKTKG